MNEIQANIPITHPIVTVMLFLFKYSTRKSQIQWKTVRQITQSVAVNVMKDEDGKFLPYYIKMDKMVVTSR